MRIQHNIMAMSAYRNYTNNVSAMKKNLEKLSSGYKINRAGDDAAGLAISEKMRAQITGLETAQKNAKDGISLVQTAEGALTEVHDMLNRMVELATQSANGTYDDTTDRYQLQKEMDQLYDEIDRIADSSNFNGIKLLDGSIGLNKDAFTISSTGFTDEKVVSDLFKDFAEDAVTTAADGKVVLHTDSTEAKGGEVTIDLSQLHLEKIKASASKATLTFNINGTSVAVASLAPTATAGAIATALASAVNKLNSNKGLLVGTADKTGLIYEAAASAGGKGITLKTKYDGAGTALDDTDTDGLGDPTADTASTALNVNWSISVAVTAGGSKVKLPDGLNPNIGSVNVTAPQAPKSGQLGELTFKMDTTKIKDGMTVEIAGQKLVFAIGSNSAHKNAANKIDLTNLTAEDAVKASNANKVYEALSQAAAADSTLSGAFSVGWNKNNYLTLTEKGKGDGTSAIADATKYGDLTGKEVKEAMKTAAGFKGLIKVTEPATNATTTIDVKKDKISEGDGLTINEKRYVFTSDKEKLKNTDPKITYVDKKLGANGLEAALKKDADLAKDYTVSVNGDTVTIQGKTADATAVEALGRGLTLQIGDTADSYNQLNVAIRDMHIDSLGLNGVKISDQVSAQNAVDKIKAAINKVSDVRGTLGATQNRLDHTINNLSVMTENIQDAESTIRDVDVAEEMMAYTKNNILIQSAQAMLAQANQVPQGVLQLLG